MRKLYFLILLGLFASQQIQAQDKTYNLIRHDAQGRPDTIIVSDPGPTPEGHGIFIEQMPEFIGDINSYIKKHFIYPKGGDCFTGRVVVQFVVSESGTLKDIQIVRSCGRKSFDQAVLEMMVKMPAWKPGKQHGVPVDVTYTLPVRIDLE